MWAQPPGQAAVSVQPRLDPVTTNPQSRSSRAPNPAAGNLLFSSAISIFAAKPSTLCFLDAERVRVGEIQAGVSALGPPSEALLPTEGHVPSHHSPVMTQVMCCMWSC